MKKKKTTTELGYYDSWSTARETDSFSSHRITLSVKETAKFLFRCLNLILFFILLSPNKQIFFQNYSSHILFPLN